MCDNKIIKTSLNDKRDKFCGLKNKKIGKDSNRKPMYNSLFFII